MLNDKQKEYLFNAGQPKVLSSALDSSHTFASKNP